MSYSIHININRKQLEKLQKIFRDFDLNGILIGSPIWNTEDLIYGPNKERLCFGFNYGSSEYAPNIVFFVARKLGKKTYWYDGNQRLKVEETFWWQRPPDTWSNYRKETYPYMIKVYDKIKLIFEQLEKKFDEYKNS